MLFDSFGLRPCLAALVWDFVLVYSKKKKVVTSFFFCYSGEQRKIKSCLLFYLFSSNK